MLRWDTKCKKKALLLPEEKRQKFLDVMREGFTLGQAMEKCGITFREAHGIIMLKYEKKNG